MNLHKVWKEPEYAHLDKTRFLAAWEAASPQHVYIGRPSKWGNPSVMDGERSRGQVVANFRAKLGGSPSMMSEALELEGRILGWIVPVGTGSQTLRRPGHGKIRCMSLKIVHENC